FSVLWISWWIGVTVIWEVSRLMIGLGLQTPAVFFNYQCCLWLAVFLALLIASLRADSGVRLHI
ncbi:hypothetical protein DKP78_16490, partial [Enterococcus faecium]